MEMLAGQESEQGGFLGGGGQPGVELGKPSATNTASGQGKPESRGEQGGGGMGGW